MNLFNRKHLRPTLICLAGAVVALFLAQIPNDTRSEWFRSLIRPEVLPRSIESKIGFIWTTIFMLAGVGTAAAIASMHEVSWKRQQVGLILAALVLNMSYTYTFTHLHNLWMATGIAAVLALLLLVLVATTARRGVWLSAVCHLPHFGWVCFATYVTSRMALLN
jgi:tryptophan-rich sensory protein